MQTTRAAGRPARGVRVRAGVALGSAAALLGGVMAATPAQAVAGAAFTTNSTGERVNQNQYASKCDVHINGGPNNNNNDLSDGEYFFSVLSPGGQLDPNDGGPKVLYDQDDPYTNRMFTVSNGEITATSSGHFSRPDVSTDSPDDLLIQLCQDPANQGRNFANTTNAGGVYILAVCALGDGYPVRPRNCKYDAFKVRSQTPPEQGDDLVAIKSADPAFTRTYEWTVEKSVDKTLVSQIGGTAAFQYTVAASRSDGVDSGFALDGEVTVFNPNDVVVSGVTVTDKTLGVDCSVTGGAASIPAGASEVFSYSCDLSLVAGTGTADTNTATVTWDASSVRSPNASTTATATYDFTRATITPVGGSTDVRDTFDGVTTTLASGITASDRFTYTREVPVPASNCITRTNTAVVTQSGDSDSETVRVCGPNSDGYTIGFWKNNSAKIITSNNAGAYCSAIRLYPAALTGLNCTAGSTGNTAANAKAINNWITKTMADGESSGTGLPMLKAQFLATVLNVQRAPALGSTNVLLTTGEVTTLGGSLNTCTSVNSVLSAANATYGSLSKTGVVVVKDVFDRINNNRQLTC